MKTLVALILFAAAAIATVPANAGTCKTKCQTYYGETTCTTFCY